MKLWYERCLNFWSSEDGRIHYMKTPYFPTLNGQSRGWRIESGRTPEDADVEVLGSRNWERTDTMTAAYEELIKYYPQETEPPVAARRWIGVYEVKGELVSSWIRYGLVPGVQDWRVYADPLGMGPIPDTDELDAAVAIFHGINFPTLHQAFTHFVEWYESYHTEVEASS